MYCPHCHRPIRNKGGSNHVESCDKKPQEKTTEKKREVLSVNTSE